jgi:hypothetical protein
MKNNNNAADTRLTLLALAAYAGLAPRRDIKITRRGESLTINLINPDNTVSIDVVEVWLKSADAAGCVGIINGAAAPREEIGPAARDAAFAALPAPHPFTYGA